MMKACIQILFLVFAIFFAGDQQASANSEWVKSKEGHSELRLISQLASLGKDDFEVLVGLEFKLEKGWHIYWKNPGDVGYPPKAKWTLPTNWKASALYFPTPTYFPAPTTSSGPIEATSFGYKDSVIYPAILSGDSLQGSSLNIGLQVDYLICENICIPASAQLKLNLPIEAAAKRSVYFQKLENSFQSLPTEDLNIKTQWKNESLLRIQSELINKNFSEKNIFIFSENKNSKFWKLKSVAENQIELEIEPTKQALEIYLKAKNGVARYTSIQNPTPILATESSGFIIALLFALLGGFVLNLMPCVLPIIFLKTNSILQLREKGKSPKKSLLLTIVGILTSFVILSVSILFLQKLGQQVGWGFQFQNPGFVTFMIFVIFLFSLNLFGVFEIQLPNFLNNKMSESSSPFFEGVFATLLATPCSAPFLGTGLSFALQQPPIVLVLFFMVMGLGFASPYIVLAVFPKLILLLPKPGNWMLRMKRILAYSLMATALWLLYVLHQQTISLFPFIVLLSMLIFFISINELKRAFRLVFITGLFVIIPLSASHFSRTANNMIKDEYLSFSTVKAQELLQTHPALFVNVTADWCITCKYNEATVLNTQWFEERLKSQKVHFISVDWTQPNDEIGKFLQENGRAGIPFSMILSKDKKTVLPELLTRGIVEKNLNDFFDSDSQ